MCVRHEMKKLWRQMKTQDDGGDEWLVLHIKESSRDKLNTEHVCSQHLNKSSLNNVTFYVSPGRKNLTMTPKISR